MELLTIGRASGLELANEVTQCSFVGDGVDDILDRAFGIFQRCFGHLKEQVVLAGDALEVGDQLALHPGFSAMGDPMHHVHQQIGERIDQLACAQIAKGGEQCQAQRLRMPPQFEDLFHGHTLPVAFHDARREAVKKARWQPKLTK